MTVHPISDVSGGGLSGLLASDAAPVTLARNEPLSLHRAEVGWIVLSGEVELFLLERDGRRTHLATFRPGQLLFGLLASNFTYGLPGTVTTRSEPEAKLVIVGLREAELGSFPLTRLQELARTTDNLREIGLALETWVDQLLLEVVEETPPKDFEILEANAETELEEADEVARPTTELVWVRLLEGRCRFIGLPALTLGPPDYLVPVSRRAWLTSEETSVLSVVTTRNVVRSGGVWEALARFHELYLELAEEFVRRRRAWERERIERRSELDMQSLRTASANLAAVLGPGTSGGPLTTASVDPLITACELVYDAQGTDLRSPPDLEQARDLRHAVSRLAASSRVRHRRVILRDDWWRRDNGPLLAFLTPSAETEASESPGQPVALLPVSHASYELVDPAVGTRVPVDGEVADRLAGEGFMFYPPLPAVRLGPLDLLSLALRGRSRDLLRLLGVGILGGLLSLLVPLVTAHLFGQVIPAADRRQLVEMTFALVLAAVAGATFQVTQGIAILRIGGKIDGSVQAAVWDRLLHLPVSFFRRFTVGDLAQRSMGIDRMRQILMGNVTTSLLSAVFSVFSFALLFYFSWRLALIATGLVILLGAATLGISYVQVRRQRMVLEVQGRISSLLFTFIHGIAKLRSAGGEKRAYARWADQFAEQRQRTLQARQWANAQTVINSFFALASSLILFAVVGSAQGASLPLSDFLAFSAAFGQFQAAALSTIGVLSSLLTMVPLYERLQPLLTELPETDATKVEAGELGGDIELAHVSFRYDTDGPLILDDVSIRAEPGEFVALVGPSGSGKSTCLRLILGFEQPESGSIYFDGLDLPSLDVQSVRRQIGVALQGGQPLAGDIFSNIVGNSSLGLEAAWEAAARAGLADDIREMPMGMHTVVSEGAGTFSGGQRQRLMIARAIVHRPRIVLFDEATSALDNKTQETVSRSLERLNATRIVVAHRLSTIVNADRIYVMENGRVVESGRYGDLIEAGGLFSRLAHRQIA